MRQYRIFYKRVESQAYATLQPFVHAAIYDKPEIKAALDHIRATPAVTGMIVQPNADEMFNIIAFDQPAEAPNAFLLDFEHGIVAATEQQS